MISTAIQQLVNYGLDTGLILPDDEIYIRNQLLMTMQLDDFTAPEGEVCYTDLESILKTPRRAGRRIPIFCATNTSSFPAFSISPAAAASIRWRPAIMRACGTKQTSAVYTRRTT